MTNEEKDYDIRLWLQSHSDPALRFSNGIDVNKLQKIINELVKRIEVLEGKDEQTRKNI
jgi:hypothetical protein